MPGGHRRKPTRSIDELAEEFKTMEEVGRGRRRPAGDPAAHRDDRTPDRREPGEGTGADRPEDRDRRTDGGRH